MRVDEWFIRQLSTDIYSALDNNMHISYGNDLTGANPLVREAIAEVKTLLETLYRKEHEVWLSYRNEDDTTVVF